jgi:hypothetical protein
MEMHVDKEPVVVDQDEAEGGQKICEKIQEEKVKS